MKPFLLLSIRADDAAADSEYLAFLGFSGLAEREMHRFRLDQKPLGPVDLRDWSGILLGGGPFNYTASRKSPVQQRVEADLRGLLDAVVAADFPFLGACYGIGALGSHQGAVVDGRYAEPVGCVPDHADRRRPGRPAAARAAAARSTPSPGTRRRSASCRRTPPCWPAPRPARCRRSGSAPTCTRPSSTPSWTWPASAPGSTCTGTPGTSSRTRPTRSRRAPRPCDVTHPSAILRQFARRYGTGG